MTNFLGQKWEKVRGRLIIIIIIIILICKFHWVAIAGLYCWTRVERRHRRRLRRQLRQLRRQQRQQTGRRRRATCTGTCWTSAVSGWAPATWVVAWRRCVARAGGLSWLTSTRPSRRHWSSFYIASWPSPTTPHTTTTAMSPNITFSWSTKVGTTRRQKPECILFI